MHSAPRPNPAERLRHVREPKAQQFPTRELAGHKRSPRVAEVTAIIAPIVVRVCAWVHTCGVDQVVYWNPRDPKRFVTPAVLMKLGVHEETTECWKTWERGIPELAIELASKDDAASFSLDEKLTRYHELGVHELIFLDLDAPEGKRLRAWDLLADDFVERVVENDRTPGVALSMVGRFEWATSAADGQPVALRLARDAQLLALESDLELALQESQRGEELRQRTEAASRDLASLRARLEKG